MPKRRAPGAVMPPGTSKTCYKCNNTHHGLTKLCAKCDSLIQRVCDPNASNTDKALAAVLSEPRARERTRLVENYCRSADTGLQELRVKYDDLMKEHLALKKREARRITLDKAKKRLGFKEKATQANLGSAFNVAEIVTYY